MRLPVHFPRSRVAATFPEDDDVSSLGEGTCKVIHVPNYSPETDPTLSPLARVFAAPEYICIPVLVAKETCKKDTPLGPPSETPDWLKPKDRKSRKEQRKAKKEQKKQEKRQEKKKHQRSRSLVASSSSNHDDSIPKPELVRKSFSDDTPAAVLKDSSQHHHRGSSSPMFNRIVIGKGGRPMYDHQHDAEAGESDDEDDSPSLGSLKDLEHVNYEDFRPPQRIEKNGAASPSLSFAGSYETDPTTETSASVDPQQAVIAADANYNKPSSGRKGMVRREFGRRFFRFGKKNLYPIDDSATMQTDNKTKKDSKTSSPPVTSSRDKTGKTVLADWKQVSGSCMV
ncbi:MAG: hypothetical protein SGILL_002326 [Bacillariaceae sp.]